MSARDILYLKSCCFDKKKLDVFNICTPSMQGKIEDLNSHLLTLTQLAEESTALTVCPFVNIEVSWKLLRVSIFDAEEFPNFNLLVVFFRKPMVWTELHDTALVREIILFEPWLQRHGSYERGQIWKLIAESVKQIQEITFKVDDRAVRDYFKLLEIKYKKKINEENKATGIAPHEETEL